MKRNFWKMLIAILVLVMSVTAFASCGDGGEPTEGLQYTSNGDGTCYVSGIGTSKSKNIVIPSTSPDGDTVTGIGKNAFSDGLHKHNIKSVVIPDTVTSIGENAFAHCSKLTSIEIPDGVTSIRSAWSC